MEREWGTLKWSCDHARLRKLREGDCGLGVEGVGRERGASWRTRYYDGNKGGVSNHHSPELTSKRGDWRRRIKTPTE